MLGIPFKFRRHLETKTASVFMFPTRNPILNPVFLSNVVWLKGSITDKLENFHDFYVSFPRFVSLILSQNFFCKIDMNFEGDKSFF